MPIKKQPKTNCFSSIQCYKKWIKKTCVRLSSIRKRQVSNTLRIKVIRVRTNMVNAKLANCIHELRSAICARAAHSSSC